MPGDPLVDWSELAHWLASVRPPESSSQSEPEIDLPKSFRQLNDHVYEVCKPPAGKRPSVEIVFFHGLQLEYTSEPHVRTWLSREKTTLWLTWLLKEHPNARILTISYDASRERTDTRGRVDMFITCENLIQCLTDSRAAVGDDGCPVVLVGHCLGGLVIEEILIKAHNMLGRDTHHIRNFLANVEAIFFYAMPHYGSQLPNADRGSRKGPLFGNTTPLNSNTQRRNEEFRQIRQLNGWISVGVGETQEVKLGSFTGLIVEEASARCNVDKYYTIQANHFDVCRPDTTMSGSFQLLSDLIATVLKKVPWVELKRPYWPKERELEESVRRASFALPFHEDSQNRYVQLGSEGRIIDTLSKTGRDCPNVVLLHGGPGKGKSTVAKQVCLKLATSTDVYLLECGRGADVHAKQMDLLQQLAVGRDDLCEIPNGLHVGSVLQTRLRELLKMRKLLILLDDLWEPAFLQAFLNLSGQEVKYLVT